MSDERVQEIIVKAQELDTLTVRKVVSTLTGFSGSGKTWLLNYLFHQLQPDLYTSTGIAEQSYQGLLLPIDNVSVDPWTLPSHANIFECLDPLFPEGMIETNATLSTSLVSPSLPSPVHSKLQPSKGTSGSRKEILLELVHMIDAGGQPEIMEIMPSVVHNTNLAVLVLNLMYSLDEHPPMYFHVEGMAYKRNMPSQYTARQIIKKLVATLRAKRSSHKKGNLFQILVVATHQDCVKGDLEAQVKALNLEMLRQEFRTSFVPGLYEPHHAIKLLCHIFTLAPLSHKQKLKTSKNSPEPISRMPHVEEKEYLMMCLLTAIPDQKLDQYIPSSSEMMPLVVKFTGD